MLQGTRMSGIGPVKLAAYHQQTHPALAAAVTVMLVRVLLAQSNYE
jgi:hypothetical protein